MRLRHLGPDDVPEAAQLTAQAFGGAPREARLRRYLRLEPEGWFALEGTRGLVGIGGVVRYQGFAWLGLMAVRSDRKGRGLGRAIAETAIEWARAHGCPTVCLIATAAGLPLYERLGFVPDGESHELSYAAPAPSDAPAPGYCSVLPWRPGDTADVARFDEPAFGCDRSTVLSAYAEEFARSSWIARDAAGAARGFLVVQDDSLGPWTAEDDGTARQLLDVALAEVRRPLRVGLIDTGTQRLLRDRGFTLTRALPRMRLGPPIVRKPQPRLLAHASYAVG
jgi:predicted N-acetyltransferase YhbS